MKLSNIFRKTVITAILLSRQIVHGEDGKIVDEIPEKHVVRCSYIPMAKNFTRDISIDLHLLVRLRDLGIRDFGVASKEFEIPFTGNYSGIIFRIIKF